MDRNHAKVKSLIARLNGQSGVTGQSVLVDVVLKGNNIAVDIVMEQRKGFYDFSEFLKFKGIVNGIFLNLKSAPRGTKFSPGAATVLVLAPFQIGHHGVLVLENVTLVLKCGLELARLNFAQKS